MFWLLYSLLLLLTLFVLVYLRNHRQYQQAGETYAEWAKRTGNDVQHRNVIQPFGTGSYRNLRTGGGVLSAKDMDYKTPGSVAKFYGWTGNQARTTLAQLFEGNTKNQRHMASFLNEGGIHASAVSRMTDSQAIAVLDAAYRNEGYTQQNKSSFLGSIGSFLGGILPAVAGSLVLGPVGAGVVSSSVGGAIGGAIAGGIKDGALGAVLGGLSGYGTGSTVGSVTNYISKAGGLGASGQAAAQAASAPVLGSAELYAKLPAVYGARASTAAGAMAQNALTSVNIFQPQDILNRSITAASLQGSAGSSLINRLGQSAMEGGMSFAEANAKITQAVTNAVGADKAAELLKTTQLGDTGMSWSDVGDWLLGNAGGIISGVGGLFSSNKNIDEIRDISQAVQYNPYGLSSPLVNVTNEGGKLKGAFTSQGQSLYNKATSAATNAYNEYSAFNKPAFSQAYYNRTTALAYPQEQYDTNRTLERVYNTGNWGSTTGDKAVYDRGMYNENQRIMREVAAQQYGASEQDRLYQRYLTASQNAIELGNLPYNYMGQSLSGGANQAAANFNAASYQAQAANASGAMWGNFWNQVGGAVQTGINSFGNRTAPAPSSGGGFTNPSALWG